MKRIKKYISIMFILVLAFSLIGQTNAEEAVSNNIDSIAEETASPNIENNEENTTSQKNDRYCSVSYRLGKDKEPVKVLKYTNKKVKILYHVVDKKVHIHTIRFKGETPKAYKIPDKIKGKKVTVLEAKRPNETMRKEPIGMFWAYFPPRSVDPNNLNSKIIDEDYPKKVIIPKTVKMLGPSSFFGRGLKTIKFEKGSKLEFIGDMAFMYATIRKIDVPSSVKVIGDEAFWSADLSGELVLPKKLRSMGSGAFYDTDITKVKIPAKLEKLEYRAFADTKLKEIVIPGNISKIESNCFGYCKKLRKITFKKYVYVESNAFNRCYNVEEIVRPKSMKKVDDGDWF